MNLQPVYPAGPQLRVVCANCNRMLPLAELKADLDADAGTFICGSCEPVYKEKQS